ncbi:hypothetical protein EsVE80_p1-00240 (plasmid) [Enterococcus saigonensis]|uniref:IS30 family transposase n=2 Tax=Enterococcus saigonensis TaxID=1805431 RepID=A0A679ISA7_9ENTE|nr:hypothetical protein EsVE80_p1-00240 [Enterococcus saigonensis]
MFFKKTPTISTTELENKLSEKPQIIDVREPHEFKIGHIPGAKNIPLAKVSTYTPKGQVYVVCQSGMRSKRATKILLKQGHNEFGHLEGDTIVGLKHKSAVITLVERLSKVIITLQPCGRQAIDIENKLNHWFESVPKNLFKSITFDCGKEFSNWKQISNANDIAIYFADPGTPSQRGLNENSNGLLRRDGLLKSMDFNSVDESFIQSVASKRNNIPRKSLNYRTPLEVFLSYVSIDDLSNLI